VVALGLLAASAAISVAIAMGTGLGFGWTTAMGASGAVHSWLAPTNELGFLIGTFGRLAGLDLTSPAIAMTTLVGAAIGGVLAVRLLWATVAGRLHPLRAIALIFAAMVVVGPVVQPWYLLWTVVSFAAIARTGWELQVLAGVSALFAVVVPPVLGDARHLVGGYLVAGLLVGGAVLLWRAPWSHRLTPVVPVDEAVEALPVPVLTVRPRTPIG
jgi:alpha-1,6-mannosyltransferase